MRLRVACVVLAVSLGLSSCSSRTATPSPAPTPASTYTLGGTVSGLLSGESLALDDTGGASLTVTANGTFSFTTQLATGTTYAVTVSTQPTGQICTVANGTGTIASSNVTSVAVSCGDHGESVLYSFMGSPDGMNVYAGVVMDSSGNLYGTTRDGGSNNLGTVFKVTPTGTETVLYSFAGGSDGSNPYASLVFDSAGNLYGTTYAGGSNNLGTVFKITPSGAETVLHTFGSGNDGAAPYAGLVMDSSGNLYGTTSVGGSSSHGTVFKITPTGTETVLHSFGVGSDGQDLNGGLLIDSNGNLYGTTTVGGSSSFGTVFKIDSTGVESILYSFSSLPDGQVPTAALVMDSNGNLYGTTSRGGTQNFGTVFKITPSGTESVLYSFQGGTDGSLPQDSIVIDSSGNLLGTTSDGGSNNQGVLFEITPSGTETVLHSFVQGNDGANPQAGLVIGSNGYLYGTTIGGGAANHGTVFQYAP